MSRAQAKKRPRRARAPRPTLDAADVLAPAPYQHSKAVEIRHHEVANVRFRAKEYDLFDLAELYHEQSKYKPYAMERAALGTSVFFQRPMNLLAALTFPGDPTRERVFLPLDFPTLDVPLGEAMRSRRSTRYFEDAPLTLRDLSAFLWYSGGVTGKTEIPAEGFTVYHRAHASGGGLYPVDIYLFAINIDGLEPALYFYNVQEHSLELVRRSQDVRADCERLWFWGDDDARAISKGYAATIAFVGTFWRSRAKYGPRGYRFTLIEAGHLAQNMYVNAGALGWGVVAQGGYLDDLLNDHIGVDGVDQAVVHTLVLGRPLPPSVYQLLEPGALRSGSP